MTRKRWEQLLNLITELNGRTKSDLASTYTSATEITTNSALEDRLYVINHNIKKPEMIRAILESEFVEDIIDEPM